LADIRTVVMPLVKRHEKSEHSHFGLRGILSDTFTVLLVFSRYEYKEILH